MYANMSGSETKPLATMKDSGMATFAKKEEDDLTCVQDHRLSDKPMLLHCGHRICERCYHTHIKDKDKARTLSCPSGDPDCDPTNIEQVRPDYYAIRRLTEIRRKVGMKQDTTKVATAKRKAVMCAPTPGSKRPTSKENMDPKRLHSDVNYQDLVQTDATATELLEKLRRLKKELADLKGKVHNMERERARMMKRSEDLDEIVQKLQRENDDDAARIKALESSAHERVTQADMGRLDSAINEVRLRFAHVENSLNTLPSGGVEGIVPLQIPPNDDGELMWKIQNYKEQAQWKEVLSITSEVFLTSREGYKLRARVYLNGDGMGAIGHYISLFVVILKGNYDALLTWPFAKKLTFTVKAQNVNGDRSRDMVKIVEFNQSLPSCERPGADPNPAFGVSKMAKIADIEAPPYLVDDTLILNISVS